jgi:hypothetical protein
LSYLGLQIDCYRTKHAIQERSCTDLLWAIHWFRVFEIQQRVLHIPWLPQPVLLHAVQQRLRRDVAEAAELGALDSLKWPLWKRGPTDGILRPFGLAKRTGLYPGAWQPQSGP